MTNPIKILLILCLFLPGCVFIKIPGPGPLVEKEVGGEGRDKIALIEITGPIVNEDRSGPLNIRPERLITDRIKEELKLIEKDGSVKAVILRINSPGGAVTTCDIIAHEIAEFKKRKKIPVVAHMMDLAASGGYYVAVGADKIVAQPTTVTGSIGVVAVFIDASGLLGKIGIADETIKSGELKDLGSPLRKMTPEERALLQEVIDTMYERFLDVVAEGRGLDKDKLRPIADGRVYMAEKALQHGLVDNIGYMEDSLKLARELAGIEKARVVTYAPGEAYKDNIYSMGRAGAALGGPSTVNLLNVDVLGLAGGHGPRFMYLWMP